MADFEQGVGQSPDQAVEASPPAPGDRPFSPAAVPRLRGPRGEVAALDLGTNNCRLLIARQTTDGFRVVDAFSRVVRLGEGLMATGRLSDAAMERALAALGACAEKLARRRIIHLRAVATEACRRAANGAEFVARVWHETGIALDVISPAEEARLAVLGCQTLIDTDARQTIVFDIGGGSTEVVLIERSGPAPADTRMAGWVSIPWGVVSLAETEAPDPGCVAARLAAYGRMTARVSAHLSGLAARLSPGVQLLGTSGTVTTLASLHLGLPHYNRRQVDGSLMPCDAMRALCRRLAALSPGERAAVPGIGADRADLLAAGCAILEALLDASAARCLRVADRGIREGILRGLLAAQGG